MERTGEPGERYGSNRSQVTSVIVDDNLPSAAIAKTLINKGLLRRCWRLRLSLLLLLLYLLLTLQLLQ